MGQIFLAENESHIYPNMCAKFGCGPTVVSKKKGAQTDRQRETAAFYNRLFFSIGEEKLCAIAFLNCWCTWCILTALLDLASNVTWLSPSC